MKVIVPLHISGIWVARFSDNPLETGSMGVGLNIAVHAKGTGKPGEQCKILLNQREVMKEQALDICKQAGLNVKTFIELPVELGKGFAVSSALLIVHSVLTHVFSNKPVTRALQLAHVLEVEHRTGLGDVIAQLTGGVAVRVKPGAPGVGLAYRVIPRCRVDLIVAELEATVETPEMLAKLPTEAYSVGQKLLREFIETEDILLFFENAKRFTSMIFDYSYTSRVLEGLKGIVGYYLKKSALVIWVEKEFAQDVLHHLKSRGIKAFKTSISQIGVNVVHTS